MDSNIYFARCYICQIALGILTATTLVLSVCAAATGGDSFGSVQNPGPSWMQIQADDPCAKEKEPFVRVFEEQRKILGQWVAAGSAMHRDGHRQEAPAGQLFGILTVAAIGYHADLEQRSTTTDEFRQAIFNDAGGDRRTSDLLVRGVTDLNRCRMNTLQVIAGNFQNNTMSKDEARTRLAAIKVATDEDASLIQAISSNLVSHNEIYVNALNHSGVADAKKYIADARTYQPIVKKATFTIKGGKVGDVTPISLSVRSQQGESTLTANAKNAVDLNAMQTAHLAAVAEGIEAITIRNSSR